MTDDEKLTQKRNFEYFLDNMERLYKEHGNKFVAVKNQGIVGVYDTFDQAVETTLKTEELGTFLIQECFDDRKKLTIQCYGNFKPVPAW